MKLLDDYESRTREKAGIHPYCAGVGLESMEDRHQREGPEALSVEIERLRLALEFTSYFSLK